MKGICVFSALLFVFSSSIFCQENNLFYIINKTSWNLGVLSIDNSGHNILGSGQILNAEQKVKIILSRSLDINNVFTISGTSVSGEGPFMKISISIENNNEIILQWSDYRGEGWDKQLFLPPRGPRRNTLLDALNGPQEVIEVYY